MIIANSVSDSVSTEVVIPKQVKLLGAKVKGVGTITTVSEQNVDRWGLIEHERGFEHHAFLCDLTKDMLELAAEQQPYRQVTRRIGYGSIKTCYQLAGVPFSDLTHCQP